MSWSAGCGVDGVCADGDERNQTGTGASGGGGAGVC